MENRQVVPANGSYDLVDRMRQLDLKLALHEKSTGSTLFEILQLVNALKTQMQTQQAVIDEERQARRLHEHTTRAHGGVLLDFASRLDGVEKRTNEHGASLSIVNSQSRSLEQAIRRGQQELAANKNEFTLKVKELQQELTSVAQGEQRLQQTTTQLSDAIQDCRMKLNNQQYEKTGVNVAEDSRFREELRREMNNMVSQHKQKVAQDIQDSKQSERLLQEKVVALFESVSNHTASITQISDATKQQEYSIRSLETSLKKELNEEIGAIRQEVDKKCAQLQQECLECSGRLSKTEKLVTTVTNAQKDLVSKLAAVRKELDGLENAIRNVDRNAAKKETLVDVNEKISKAENALRAEITSRRSNEEATMNRVRNLEIHVVDSVAIRKNLAKSEEQSRVLSLRVEGLESDVQDLRKAPFSDKIQRMQEKIDSLNRRTDQLDEYQQTKGIEAMNEVKNQLAMLSAELKVLHERARNAEVERKRDMTSIGQELEQLKSNTSGLISKAEGDRLDSARTKTDTLGQRFDQAEDDRQQQYRSILDAYLTLKNELERVSKQLKVMEQRVATSEQAVAMQRSQASTTARRNSNAEGDGDLESMVLSVSRRQDLLETSVREQEEAQTEKYIRVANEAKKANADLLKLKEDLLKERQLRQQQLAELGKEILKAQDFQKLDEREATPIPAAAQIEAVAERFSSIIMRQNEFDADLKAQREAMARLRMKSEASTDQIKGQETTMVANSDRFEKLEEKLAAVERRQNEIESKLKVQQTQTQTQTKTPVTSSREGQNSDKTSDDHSKLFEEVMKERAERQRQIAMLRKEFGKSNKGSQEPQPTADVKKLEELEQAVNAIDQKQSRLEKQINDQKEVVAAINAKKDTDLTAELIKITDGLMKEKAERLRQISLIRRELGRAKMDQTRPDTKEDEIARRFDVLSQQMNGQLADERAIRAKQIDEIEKRIGRYDAATGADLKAAAERTVLQEVEKQVANGELLDVRKMKQQIQKIEQIQERKFQEHERRLSSLETKATATSTPATSTPATATPATKTTRN